MEAAERQARELQEWRAVKEHELAELYEMVEAGQVRVCASSTARVERWMDVCVINEIDRQCVQLRLSMTSCIRPSDDEQAFEEMVESLTTKNLELEERVADLRVAVSELEVRSPSYIALSRVP